MAHPGAGQEGCEESGCQICSNSAHWDVNIAIFKKDGQSIEKSSYFCYMKEHQREPWKPFSWTWMEKSALFLGFGLVLIVVIRTAWQSDDAYITYRCLDNALNGLGLTYNPAERVQAFTHPLWALLQLVVVFFTGEVYFTGIFLGIIFTLLTLWVIARRFAQNPFHFLFACLALLSSSAWVDYTTSGLENSLSYFLLAVFAAEWLGKKRLFNLCLIASLVVLNRMDMLLLVAPALFVTWWPQKSLKTVGTVLLGFMPFLVWELFAIFYYGFPFPNTAYAKLNVAIPGGELFQRGLDYFYASLNHDSPTVLLPILGLTLGFIGRRPRLPVLSIGIIFYMIYIVKIGGDFMEGRFLTGPILISVVILLQWISHQSQRRSNLALGGLSLVMVGLSILQSPASILTGGRFLRERADVLQANGIADERAFYYPQSGLLPVLANPDRPIHVWMNDGNNMRDKSSNFNVAQNMGFMGYASGPEVFLIDGYALTDPLLCRLPPMYNPSWRAGHLHRAIPEGYLEGLQVDENRLVEPDLNELYEKLRLVTRGDLWSWDRIKTIIDLNTGGAKLQNQDRFLYPVTQFRDSEYPIYPEEGEVTDSTLEVNVGHFRGVEIKLKPGDSVGRIDFGLEPGYGYVVMLKGEDGFTKGALVENGVEGVEFLADGTMTYSLSLQGGRNLQEGDVLRVYGIWVYGKQTLKYVKVARGE